tara:strand:+ start:4875 stop:5384 length:510 start_codon:yes stop_codon:yes gene_type:complete
MDCLGFSLGESDELVDGGFKLKFPDGSTTECLVLVPPEKLDFAPWQVCFNAREHYKEEADIDYHMASEVFISDGPPGSIVGDWVAARGGVGGIHHVAYQVDDVELTMAVWAKLGYAEFASEKPLTCPGLTQVFTKPSELTGIIYELIHREKQGFCKENVVDLMTSTKDF